MASYNYAKMFSRSAYLNTDFGLQLAMKKFDLTAEEIESHVGRYTRGKRKGELRGKLEWISVTHGGWVPASIGFVCKMKITFNYQIVSSWDGEWIYQHEDFHEDICEGCCNTYMKKRKELEERGE